MSELPLASSTKRVLVLILSYENEFNLHVNEISFSYEFKSRLEEEAKGCFACSLAKMLADCF